MKILTYLAPFLFLGSALYANPPRWAQFLPSNANIASIQADALGGIYVAGQLPPPSPKGANDSSDAFLAKYSPNGDPLFFKTFGGLNSDSITALAIGSDGAIYAAGNTASADFPTTATAQLPPAPGSGGPFLAKFDASGATVFSVVYGLSTTFAALAVDDQGQAVVTGYQSMGGTSPFVAKLSQDGTRVLFTFPNYGGMAIALDSQQNIYVAGATSEYDPAMTPGAFETQHNSQPCSYAGMFGVSCVYQHAAKISASGTKLIYATFLDGTFGATPSALAVDSNGNAILAGTTYSSDFPVTPGALQTTSTAMGTYTLQPGLFFGGSPPPPISGFITKLNASGSDLLWSTYFSGTREDSISSLSIAPDSSIYLAGLAGSADLPGLQGAPGRCRPKFLQFVPYVAHLGADASAIFSAALFGDTLAVLSGRPSVVAAPSGQTVAATLGQNNSGAEVASLDLDASTAMSCIVDAADTAPIASVAPGQLITILGRGLDGGCNAPQSSFPTGFCNVKVTFNGIPAPLLYTAANQVNAQVPFEVSAADTVTMNFTSQTTGEPGVNETQRLRVVPSSPAIFRSTETTALCGPSYVQNVEVVVPLARNADGSMNSACNPAAYGSTITLYVNGAGSLGIPETTGGIAPQPAVPLNLEMSNIDTLDIPATVTAVRTLPGSISGLVQLQLTIPLGTNYYFSEVNLNFGAIPFRDQAAVIWVK